MTEKELAEMMSDIQYLFKENLRLRTALSDCGNAVGGAVGPNCSLEFLECVTQEVRLVTERLRRERAEALLDAERAREERNREHVRLNAEWMAKCDELRKDADEEVAGWMKAAEASAAEVNRLRKAQAFAGIVLGTYRSELSDLDGFWLQEQAQAHGMIEERYVNERCGEDCVCAEVVTSFPTSCFVITDAGKVAIDAAMAKTEGAA